MTKILQAAQVVKLKDAVPDMSLDILVSRRYNTLLSAAESDDLDAVPSIPALSLYKKAAVGYIAGFVVYMVNKKIHCPECEALAKC
ncbi:hypothetical protein EOD39_10198 [Acipenser ruthenus]|uniref:Uncharacterized protein n=1 Tax=Acipenser ruthenus TaxID=7906 RepID=A0A444TYB7_ACIRT|nr:hypothetical protein EOD39_10198 [Acipenser ruthenus]